MKFRLPFVVMRRKWKEGLDKEVERLREENVILRRANVASAKIIGVMVQRAPVRIAVKDLQARGTPQITMAAEEHSSKPTLRVHAHYGCQATIPNDQAVIVGKDAT